MDFVAIHALVASLKTAADVSKALFDLKLTSEVQAKVSELQSALLVAQSSALAATSAQFELQERVRELEAKLKAVDDWNATKSRYALATPWRGAAQVYVLRKSAADGEEPHFVCTNCFTARKCVILNPARLGNRTIMMCPTCKGAVETGYASIARAKYAEEYVQAGSSDAPANTGE